MNFLKFLKAESPGMLRPLRGLDLNDICNVFSAFGAGYGTDPVIFSGCRLNNSALTDGFITYNGQLYTHDSTSGGLSIGQPVYVGTVDTQDTRVYGDGLQHTFSEQRVARSVSFVGATQLTANLSLTTYYSWCGNRLNDNTLRAEHFRDGCVPNRALQTGGITSDKIAPQGLDTYTYALGSVTSAVLADDSVTPSKIPLGSITGSKVGVDTIDYVNLAARTLLAVSAKNLATYSAENDTPTGCSMELSSAIAPLGEVPLSGLGIRFGKRTCVFPSSNLTDGSPMFTINITQQLANYREYPDTITIPLYFPSLVNAIKPSTYTASIVAVSPYGNTWVTKTFTASSEGDNSFWNMIMVRFERHNNGTLGTYSYQMVDATTMTFNTP